MPNLLTEIHRGRQYVIPVTYKVAGVAANITGFTFTLMIKKKLSLPNASAVLTKNAAITVPLSGQMVLTITKEESAAMAAGTYIYDFTAINAANIPTFLEQKGVEIKTPVNLPA